MFDHTCCIAKVQCNAFHSNFVHCVLNQEHRNIDAVNCQLWVGKNLEPLIYLWLLNRQNYKKNNE